jgi:hypothetical protein
MSADWKAGDRALCVDDAERSNPSIAIEGPPVVRGTIYLVRDVRSSRHGVGLYLEGVFGGIHFSGREVAYRSDRFRKIVPACDRQAVAQERGAGV